MTTRPAWDQKEFVRRDFLSTYKDANGNVLRSFYSLRENAWHGLGQVVERPVTDDEALKLSGLDWELDLVPLCRADMVPIDSHMAAVRGDTKITLGVVGKNYTPVQNRELFAWMRGLEAIGEVMIETAGALMDGSTVWVQARIKDLHFDVNGDEHQGYLSLTNGHCANRLLTLTPTMTRQVCNNTTRMITGQKRLGTLATGFNLRHSRGVIVNLEAIKDMYVQTAKAWKETEEALRLMASAPLTEESINRMFIEPWIPKPATAEAKAEAEAAAAAEVEADESTRASAIRMEREKRLREILASETCQTKNKDTVFSAFNAVTEFLEHDTTARGKAGLTGAALERTVKASRFESNLDGKADEIKGKALKLALELAGA